MYSTPFGDGCVSEETANDPHNFFRVLKSALVTSDISMWPDACDEDAFATMSGVELVVMALRSADSHPELAEGVTVNGLTISRAFLAREKLCIRRDLARRQPNGQPWLDSLDPLMDLDNPFSLPLAQLCAITGIEINVYLRDLNLSYLPASFPRASIDLEIDNENEYRLVERTDPVAPRAAATDTDAEK